MENFGEYVRELRKRNRLTLKQAEKLGVASNAYLSQLERGHRKRPQLDILKEMARVYKVPLNDLLIAAGHLTPEAESKSEKERVEDAFREVQNDTGISFGTRHRGPKFTLGDKRTIVKLYEKLKVRKLL